MSHLLKYELKKVFGRRLFWRFIVFILTINFAILWWGGRGDDYTPSAQEYCSFYNVLRPLNNTEKEQFLKQRQDFLLAVELKQSIETRNAQGAYTPFIKDEEQQYVQARIKYQNELDKATDYAAFAREESLVNSSLSDLKTISNYHAYLSKIRTNAELLSATTIFGTGDSFSTRNIQKTLADYATMDSINPRYDAEKGVMLLLNSKATDLLILLLVLAVCLLLITDEKEKRLLILVKATKEGNGRTAAAKLIALLLLTAVTTTVMFCFTAVFAQAAYGLGDLSRPVQSLPELLTTSWQLNLGEYLVLLLMVKIIGYCIIGLFVFLLAVHVKHPIMVIAGSLTISVAEAILIQLIPLSSELNWFHILNLLCLAEPNLILGNYLNLNFFGFPINSISIFIVFAAILFIGLLIADCLSFVHRKPCADKQSLMQKVFTGSSNRCFRGHTHIIFYEFRKTTITNMVLLLVLLFALLQSYTINNTKFYRSPEDYYYHHYMVMLQGTPTNQKRAFLEKEQAKFDEAETKKKAIEQQCDTGSITWEEAAVEEQPLEKILAGKDSFSKVVERYRYVEAHHGTQMVYDTGYLKLFGISDANAGLNSGLRLVIILILCLCGVFSIEYSTGMQRVMVTTTHGKFYSALCKILISAGFSLFLFVCAYTPDLFLISHTFRFPAINAPLASLPQFSNWSISIVEYMALLFGVRLLICWGIMLIILAISSVIKNNVYTCLASAFLLATFPVLHFLDIKMFDDISLVPFLLTNPFFLSAEKNVVTFIQVVTFLILSGYSCYICISQRLWPRTRKKISSTAKY